MKKPTTANKGIAKKAAVERIQNLFLAAEQAFKKDQKLADRCVKKARRAAQRVRMGIPAEFKKRFCRHCGGFWVHGKTVRVRLQKQKVVYYCLSCKHYTRHPYVREKKERRKAKSKPVSVAYDS